MASSTSFTATVSAITDAFGDPTRRRIYLYVRDHVCDDGVTASMVATEVGVHPNVARHHLDKLAAGGYLEVATGRLAGGGAGRPSKRYTATTDAFTDFPVRSGHRSLRSAIQAVADALTAHGFAAHAEGRNDHLRIINDHCPFGEVATEHPVICAVDRGMVRGMLAQFYGEDGEALVAGVVTESSMALGDTFCSTTV